MEPARSECSLSGMLGTTMILLVLLMVGCGPEERMSADAWFDGDVEPDAVEDLVADADTDSASDGDSDADADTDSASDGDSDAGAGA